jgi:hypothetical protein
MSLWQIRDFISCLKIGPKYDLSVADKAMFQGVDRPCEVIFCLLNNQRCYLDEIEEVMFQ